jgi:hypothetical protein
VNVNVLVNVLGFQRTEDRGQRAEGRGQKAVKSEKKN